MKEDLVSIVVPVYNCEKFIRQTINTVKKQTYNNWELLLVNDCSTDRSKEIIIKELKDDDRIKLLELEKNSGAAIARNKGIENARGKYIAFLDADDLWNEEKIEKQIRFMKDNGYEFTFTGYEFVDENGIDNKKIVKVPEKINYRQALKNTTIFTSTVIFDVEKLGKGLIKMPNVRRGQDTATWWKVLKTNIIAYGLNETLSLYRRSNNTLSANKMKALKRTWNLYRNVEHLNVFYSLYNFSWYVFNAVKRRISTMNLKSQQELVKKLNVKKNVIINQTSDINNVKDVIYGKNRLYSYNERGLSKSRNKAIMNSNADICIIADDDLKYESDYEEKIKNGYKKYKDAGIIAFYVDNVDKKFEKKKRKEGKINLITSMKIQSVQITFKRKSIIDKKIKFNELFGTGTELYSGEENIFLADCIRNNLKIYYIPEKIATIQDNSSTWRKGYDKQYFYTKGATFYAISNIWYYVFILQFVIRKRNMYANEINLMKAFRYMIEGAREYKKYTK